jgi:hypothetical protein
MLHHLPSLSSAVMTTDIPFIVEALVTHEYSEGARAGVAVVVKYAFVADPHEPALMSALLEHGELFDTHVEGSLRNGDLKGGCVYVIC